MALVRHNAHPPHLFFHVTDGNSSQVEMERWVERGNRAAGQRLARALRIPPEAGTAAPPPLDTAQEQRSAYSHAAMNLLTEQPLFQDMCHWAMITDVESQRSIHAQPLLSLPCPSLISASPSPPSLCCVLSDVYSGHFLDRVEQEMAKGYQLIGMNMISRYELVSGAQRDTREGVSDDGTSHLLDIDWRDGRVRMGATVWNASLWKRLQRGSTRVGEQRLNRTAEGHFFEQLVELNVSRIAIRQIMLIHQAEHG